MLITREYIENKDIIEGISSELTQNVSVMNQIPGIENKYRDSLGWLRVSEWADDTHLNRIYKIAEKVRKKAEVFVLIGVGGSNNAARAVIEALKTEGNPEIIYAGNTLSSDALNKMLASLEGKSVYLDCIAKNFETLEPGASFRILRRYLENTYGDRGAAERTIATGTKGSSLEKLCEENGYTFLEFPEDIGGRYTAMTNVGLLPMAVAGIDIRSLVRGASDMEMRLKEDCSVNNPAYRYACYRNALYKKGYRVEILSSFEPQFRWFFKWWQQLFAESEGKDGKGIFPSYCEFSEDLHSVGQFIQSGTHILFETFLTIKNGQSSLIIYDDGKNDFFDYLNGKDFKDINRIDFEATIQAHSKVLPCMNIELDRLGAYEFGELFYFFQYACYISAEILGVNPFDQPGVEAYKTRLFAALGK